jgi:SPP1 gp7 family putative phage head morphogenesis protein
VNELLQEYGISHSVYLERYKTQVLKDVIELMEKVDKDLVARIASRAGEETFTKARLERMLQDIRQINAEAVAELKIGVRDKISEFGQYESEFQSKRIQQALPIRWQITQPAPDQIFAAVMARPFEGKLFEQHIQRYEQRRLELIQGALRQGWAEGESIDQIVRRIRGRRSQGYADGIIEATRKEAGALVRTAINNTASVAREELYRNNGDLVKGVQYVATLDNRTTLICANLDGSVYKVGEGPRPPQHWGCRSTTVPVVRSWKELGIDLDEASEGTRASMNGQVAEKTTYGAWLKKQPASVQKDVLGKKRYQMFKEGGGIDRFVQDGRVLTLDELKRKEAA